MNKEAFLQRLIFDDATAESEAQFYLDTKGVAFHLQIAEHLGFDMNNPKQKIEWSKVSALLRYDKRLRQKIYIYLATLEEYIRAYISNKYESTAAGKDFWFNTKKGKRPSISNRIKAGEKLFDILQSIDFGELIEQALNLPIQDLAALFTVSSVKSNLDAVRDLRNAVSHHVFLRGHKFKECIVDGHRGNTLEYNIKNLRQLLPEQYRFGKNGKGGITADINKCRFERVEQNGKKVEQEMLLDSRDIARLDNKIQEV